MELSVTLSANAGVSVVAGENRLWVDALHDQKERGFSSVSPQLQGKMLSHPNFQNPRWICFTHCHGDHFSQKLTQAAERLWPNAAVFLPESWLDKQTRLSGDQEKHGQLTFYRFPHEGAQYADVSHYGLIAEFSGKHILFAGDCATASEALAEVLKNQTIDLAVLPFPWLTLSRGREFIEKYLPAAKLVICHLPFAQDDENGYRAAAQKAEKLMPGWDIRLMMQPLQTEIFKM